MDRSTHVWWYSCTNPHICLEVHPSAGLLADEEPAQVEVGMVLGNVASSPLLDGTRSIQLSSISSTPYRTPCGPQLRFGRRITSIERLGGSPLVPRLLRSFHWEYRSKECADQRNLEETYIINTNLTSRGKKLLKLLIKKTRLTKIFEIYRDKSVVLQKSTSIFFLELLERSTKTLRPSFFGPHPLANGEGGSPSSPPLTPAPHSLY